MLIVLVASTLKSLVPAVWNRNVLQDTVTSPTRLLAQHRTYHKFEDSICIVIETQSLPILQLTVSSLRKLKVPRR